MKIYGLLLAMTLAVAGCPDDSGSDDQDTTGADTVIADTAPVDTTPTDTAPVDTTPTDTTPVDTTPTDTTPVDTLDANDTTVADTSDATDTSDVAGCANLCDCDQGLLCSEGSCVAGTKPAYCCTNDGCPANTLCTQADGADGVCGLAPSPMAGKLVINEVLTDGETDGDPNGDGDAPDAVGDQFVEIVNVSGAAIDLSAMTLFETDFRALARHTFDANLTLADGDAVVVFGGGTAPDDIAGATFFVANAQDPGIAFGLALDKQGDILSLLDADGKMIAFFAYGSGTGQDAVTDQSVTRKPELTGDFTPHGSATSDATNIFSPGTHADGTSF